MRLRRFIIAAAVVLASLQAIKTGAATLPPGFQETIVFSGLTRPTAVRFASDGRVFVAEKSGLIKVFDSLSSPTPTIFADLSTEVDDYWDRGLLGLALHPNFPTTPFVYVLYSYDAPIGGESPTWHDACPSPPGTSNGCVISGRLSRLTAAGSVMTGTEEVLLEAWGQQFPSHSIGDLHFAADGSLYVSGGDGASFNNVDYGQYGIPKNPLGDPPSPVGTPLASPDAEGGALRSQSLLRAEGGPVLTNGTILRVDADGQPLPDNPLFGSSDPITQRIVAFGLRNPFRFTIQPTTGSLWIGDVGWSAWEEIDQVDNPLAGSPKNFGWPCYEGAAQQPGYLAADLDLCANLYSAGTATRPFYTYNHTLKVVSGETCPIGSSSISGIAFYGSGGYPSTYNGALFFADYSRQCVWVMFPDAQGRPVASTRATFIAGAATPVDLQIGPGGDLFYADLGGGTVRRVQSFAPTAAASAAPLSGAAPLAVQFDGSGSHAARQGDTITYAWDLQGEGTYEDSTEVSPAFVYSQPGSYAVRLRVTDNHDVSSVSDPVTVVVNGASPTATIDSPSPTLTWKVGDTISFSGHATDPQEGALPPSALSWTLTIRHCPSNCHTHTVQTFPGVASGSFATPDHEYPSFLELKLTATNTKGITHSQTVALNPKTVLLTFQSSPPGMSLIVATGGGTTPFTQTVIVGSEVTIEAAPTQTFGGIPYGLAFWSDGGAPSHSIQAGAAPATYIATYRAADLSVAAGTSSAQACAGGALTYTLTAHNAGPTVASSVSVAVTLPSGASLQTASGDGWSCAGSPVVTCTRASLSVGDSPAIVLAATAPALPGSISASVSVSAATSDPNAANDTVAVGTTVHPTPSTDVTAPVSVCLTAADLQASVPDAGPGATYAWSIENGAITSGQGASAIHFTVGPSAGQPAVLHVTVTTAAGCAASGSSSVPVVLCAPEVTAITPTSGPASGAMSVTATGDHFEAGASVTIGGIPAGNVVVTPPTTISATAPPLPPGTLNDVVTSNPNGQSGELLSGYFSDFSDVPASHLYHRAIEKIFRAGITSGCSTGNYCPTDLVNRASMAVFLLRGKKGGGFHPPVATGTLFTDVPLGTYLGDWIEELSREGITTGCGVSVYCPDAAVSRASMAVFLLRAKHAPGYHPPAATGTLFTDVPLGTYLGDWIEELSREGITGGCGGNNYCPDGLVSRGEMAVFLSRTFSLP